MGGRTEGYGRVVKEPAKAEGGATYREGAMEDNCAMKTYGQAVEEA